MTRSYLKRTQHENKLMMVYHNLKGHQQISVHISKHVDGNSSSSNKLRIVYQNLKGQRHVT